MNDDNFMWSIVLAFVGNLLFWLLLIGGVVAILKLADVL